MRKVGILGGGQLAMMLAQAAKPLGLHTKVLAPNADCPAKMSADQLIAAEYEDLDAVMAFADDCDVVTFEFENVPVRSLFALQKAGIFVAPGPKVLEVVQDRLTEKQFLDDCGIALAAYARIDSATDFTAAIQITALPAVLKTRHFGYDGKGQSWIKQPSQAMKAFDLIHHHPAVLEAGIDFVREVSVIAARNAKGEFVAFPVTENQHEDGILRRSHIPADCSEQTTRSAIGIAREIADQLEYVGVLAVEFFETNTGKLLVNEIAPRVHNSGHWTKGGAIPDQFEMHLRAITGMEMPEPKVAKHVKMVNLIGDELDTASSLTASGWQVIDYGKGNPRPGRKMGHGVKVHKP